MKQIYEVGTAQYFTYTWSKLFKKTENHWVLRNIKYIYASSEKEAKEKYKHWFFIEYKKIINGWENWCLHSDGVDIFSMSDRRIKITDTKIKVVGSNDDLNINYDNLKNNMQAEDFKEWWFDNGRCNRIPE